MPHVELRTVFLLYFAAGGATDANGPVESEQTDDSVALRLDERGLS